MDLNAILDYCDEWNKVHDIGQGNGSDPKKPKIRDATQEDIDKFLG